MEMNLFLGMKMIRKHYFSYYFHSNMEIFNFKHQRTRLRNFSRMNGLKIEKSMLNKYELFTICTDFKRNDKASYKMNKTNYILFSFKNLTPVYRFVFQKLPEPK